VKLTFLGTGTSYGVPVVGCDCGTCKSRDSRDRRFRHSAAIRWDDGRTVLVDTPPELRLQLLRSNVTRIDAVWFTHVHADHLHGIDDLRIFSIRDGRRVRGFASSESCAVMARRFDYIFDDSVRPQAGSTKPQVSLEVIEPGRPVLIADEPFMPVEVPHGGMRSMGFRVGDLGYATDAKRLPPEAVEQLKGVKVLVLNALWWGDPHPTHFNIEEAIEVAGRLGAEVTYLTHLTHRVRHEELERMLPPEVRPAFDGLSVTIPGPGARVGDTRVGDPREAEGTTGTGDEGP